MNPMGLLIAVLVTLASASPGHGAPGDYAAFRKAADAVAAPSLPGSKLWRVDLTGVYRSHVLQIKEAKFHYFRLGANNQLDLLPVQVNSAEGTALPQGKKLSPFEYVDQRTGETKIQRWQLAPIPGNTLSPDDALRRLDHPLPEGLDTTLRLVQTNAAIADNSKNRWLSSPLGLDGVDTLFFYKTAPLGQWVWWTVVQLNRPQQGRIQEYLYVDAVTGTTTSACLGPRSAPIACEGETEGGTAPRAGPWLMVTGQVKSAAVGKLVIVTTVDMSASLKKGTELTFEFTQPYLRRINFHSGDYVNVRYENRPDGLRVREITFTPVQYQP